MRCLFLILCILVELVGFCSPIKNNIAARNIEFVNEEKASYTARDYVQDGLIAMWDGIENVSYGEHDDEATAWIDLVNAKKLNGNVVNGNSFKILSTSIIKGFTLTNDMTIELVRNSSIDFTTAIMLTYGTAGSASLRYAINGVRSGYALYQLRYWDGASIKNDYQLKTYVPISMTYSNNIISIYGNNKLLSTHDDAIASEIDGLVI